MKTMSTQIVFLSLLLGLAFASENCGISDADKSIDKFLEQTQRTMEETFPLDSFTEGPIVFENGEMWGLNTLYRNGSALVTCEDGVTKIDAVFAFAKPVRVRYEWKAGRLLKLNGVAYARSTTMRIRTLAVKQVNGTWTIEKLRILDLSDIEVEVSGLAHLSWIWSKITSFFANRFESLVALVVQRPLTEVINRALSEINL